MFKALKIAVFCLIGLASASFAESQSTPLAWQVESDGKNHFASIKSPKGLAAIVNFQAGSPGAQMLITGIWDTRPLDLRLWVHYKGGRRAYIDTFRAAEITMLGNTRAYKLSLPSAQLRPLRGGDMLVIEDLKNRAELPLTGSAKALSAAAQAAAGN